MGTLTEAIPEELRALDRWVCANRDSKRPMRCFDGGAASVSKPDTWGSFDEACECIARGIYAYAGFVFADDGLVGIDIDHAFGEDGMLSEEASEAIAACASYTEVSKSGGGIHIICRGSIPFRGRNNREGWEIYRDARYFVLTGRTVIYGEVADAQEGIDAVLATHFADMPRDGARGRGPLIWEPVWEDRDDGRVNLTPTYPVVSSGARHISLVSYCGQLWQAGCSEDALLELALAQNQRYLDPPLGEAEVNQIVQSCKRYRR